VTNAGGRKDVYNFEVHGHHNYFVGTRGVLVHNSSGDQGANFELDILTPNELGDDLYGAISGSAEVTWRVPEPGVVRVIVINRGDLPKGSGGKLMAQALSAAGTLPTKKLTIEDITNEPTMEGIARGLDPADTVLGRTASGALDKLGLRASQFAWVEGPGERKIVVDIDNAGRMDRSFTPRARVSQPLSAPLEIPGVSSPVGGLGVADHANTMIYDAMPMDGSVYGGNVAPVGAAFGPIGSRAHRMLASGFNPMIASASSGPALMGGGIPTARYLESGVHRISGGTPAGITVVNGSVGVLSKAFGSGVHKSGHLSSLPELSGFAVFRVKQGVSARINGESHLRFLTGEANRSAAYSATGFPMVDLGNPAIIIDGGTPYLIQRYIPDAFELRNGVLDRGTAADFPFLNGKTLPDLYQMKQAMSAGVPGDFQGLVSRRTSRAYNMDLGPIGRPGSTVGNMYAGMARWVDTAIAYAQRNAR
jgi:hypothetical protein